MRTKIQQTHCILCKLSCTYFGSIWRWV